ncbi:SusC/RagA family TonB-linked outer membrane protein [Fodinibius roseus]|nr:SusC/RagA family TonB-linked outer membrane protein [Fodinibius roseus]
MTQDKEKRSVLWRIMILAFGFLISHGFYAEANGQYLTSASVESVDQSFYSVSDYSDRLPELQRLVSVDAEEIPIRQILEDIVAKADLGLAYNAGLLSLKRPVTIQLRYVPVGEALQQVLAFTGYEATISKMREIVLRKRLYRLPSLIRLQQELSGRVTDAETGDPLPGVNVVVTGDPSVGTSTDEDGEYRLTAPDDAQSLTFSFIGYQELETPIDGRSTINAELQPQVQTFEDVVVTALGISREERSIGYSTQQVDGENLTFSKEQNVIGSLAGKIAGVQITGSSGASLGGTQTIKIRGINSLSGEGQPLIVVDGTPISNANFAGSAGADFGNLAQDINPNDIESVNVLKGPAASALYGIRGQYGVVMITTEKGAGREDFQVELNSGFSVQKAANFMEFQNKYGGGSSQEWNTLENGQKYVQTWVDESWGPPMDGSPVREYFSFYPQDPQYGEVTPFDAHPDNIRNFYETGYKLNQSITISGGGESSNYRLSFDDSRISGVYPNSNLNRNNLGVSAGIDVSDQWNFSTNLNYAINDARRPPQGSEHGSRYFRQWFQRNLDMSRLKDYRYSDGTVKHWNISGWGDGESGAMPYPVYWSNPYFEAHEDLSEDSRNRIFGDVGATFNALPELSVSAFIRGDMYVQNIEYKTASGGTDTPDYTVGKYENREMNYELKAQYSQNWDDFSLDATLGTNVYDRNYSYLYQSTEGGLTADGYYNIEASVDRPENESYLLEKRILSAYALTSLGYNDTYFVDVSIRNDKSSALPEDSNSYWYPSVSGSLVFSELVDWDPLSFGKLRLSYSRAGSDLSPYQTQPVYGVGTVYDGRNTLLVPDEINNPDIEPSFSTSYEAGIDLNFFSRIEFNFTYYQQKNENQIIPLSISGASGYEEAIINAGLIENEGIELSVSGTPVRQEYLSWDATFNLGRNQNEVVRLHPDIDRYQHGSTEYSSTWSYMNSYEGRTYGSLVGRAYQRDEATGQILLDDNNLPLWTDATHNFGSVLPDFTGGVQNVLRYRNFSLGAMIDFQVGGQFFSRSKMLAVRTGLAKETAALNDKGNNVRDPVDEGGGVKVEGISASTGEPVTAYVDASTYFDTIGDEVYEDWVIDASYVKLNEVRFGYTVDQRILERWPVRSVELAIFANNPWMIWQEAPQGLDPSELSTGGQDITWYESGQLNTVRTFGLNISLTF